MNDKNKSNFSGSQINVEWDGRLCIHIAECGRAKGELFVAGRQPWCEPDLMEVEEVAEIVERCPAGAITYNAKDPLIKEKPAAENTIAISNNGPLFVSGDIKIENTADDMEGVSFRTALCRCGHSKNKPFCDNAHEKAKFQDYGAVGDTGEGLSSHGGKFNIKPLDDGPLLCSGNITLKSASGRTAWEGKQVALCRCGVSENKPFCDGKHVAAGFRSQ